MNYIKKRHEGKVEGSTGWYSETVKLDLEARKIIERKIDVKPQICLLKNKNRVSKHRSTGL